MKKIIILLLALGLTFSVGYVTLASTIGIGATEGFQAEVGGYVKPSDYDDNLYLTAYYGLDKNTQFSLKYATDSEDLTLGARYAFTKNMAVTLELYLPDAAGADNEVTAGFRYKAKLDEALALVGVLEFTDTEPDSTINLIGQAEYAFNDKVVATLGFDYYDNDQIDGIDIIIGVETYPVDKLTIYLDYIIPDQDDDDNLAYLGVKYAF